MVQGCIQRADCILSAICTNRTHHDVIACVISLFGGKAVHVCRELILRDEGYTFASMARRCGDDTGQLLMQTQILNRFLIMCSCHKALQ